MKFVGNQTNSFNKALIPLLNELSYTVVSCIDGDYSYCSTDRRVIQILSIDDDFNYYKVIDKAYYNMITNGFSNTLQTCTSIIIVKPDLIPVEKVANIINTLETDMLVDNIWIYPDPVTDYQVRNNEIGKLPFQCQTK